MSAPVDRTLVPALYDAEVRHLRTQRMRRSFGHRVQMWLVDLDHLPRLPGWLRPFARFRARDHLGDPTRSIRENLEAWLALRGVDLRGGKVLMLAHPRVLGHVFNPITVYWCHRPDGEQVCVVTEVHNTYGERHCYLLRPDGAGRANVRKDFYVSPFLAVDGHYTMRLPLPGDRLDLGVLLQQSGATALAAMLTGTRRAVTPAAVLRRALITYRVTALIRRHGIALWLRRLPVIPRPAHRRQEGVQ